MPSDTGSGRDRSPEGDPVSPLTAWMDAKRVTAAELARRLGVSRNAVHSWRQGIARPGDDMKVKIAEATLEIERELGITEHLSGVPITAWYPAAVVATAAKAG